MTRSSAPALFTVLLLAACSGSSEKLPPSQLSPSQDAGAADVSSTGEQDAAGGTEEDAAVPGQDSGLPYYTWWGEVRGIVHTKCILCHANPPQFGAPRSLAAYADTQLTVMTTGARVHEMMAYRVSAPQNAMPPPTQPQLTAQEKEIIMVWSAIGAPEGTPPVVEDAGMDPTDANVEEDAGPVVEDAGVAPDAGNTAQTRILEVLAHEPSLPNDPYAIPVDDTQYVCWSITVPAWMAAAQEHAVAIEPVVDNTTHLHHLLLFKNEGGGSQDGPFDCGSWPLDWELIGGWAPGRTTDYLPAGAGVRLEQGMQLVVQAHYDSVTAPGQTDRSGFRVHTTDTPGLTEAGMLWSGMSWFNALNGANVDRVATCTINTSFTMFAVFPHMHQLGTRITLEVQRSGQSNWTTLVDIDPWSFEDQPNVTIPMAEQLVNPGDKLRTHCWWNTMGQSVPFGEASDDEMCFNFIYHYPLISNAYTCWDLQL